MFLLVQTMDTNLTNDTFLSRSATMIYAVGLRACETATLAIFPLRILQKFKHTIQLTLCMHTTNLQYYDNCKQLLKIQINIGFHSDIHNRRRSGICFRHCAFLGLTNCEYLLTVPLFVTEYRPQRCLLNLLSVLILSILLYQNYDHNSRLRCILHKYL